MGSEVPIALAARGVRQDGMDRRDGHVGGDPASLSDGPAYPSGHSTQAHLIAHVLTALVPAKTHEIFTVAHDIARNREIAGMHYSSDSQAGERLAIVIFSLLTGGGCPRFIEALDDAKEEWRS